MLVSERSNTMICVAYNTMNDSTEAWGMLPGMTGEESVEMLNACLGDYVDYVHVGDFPSYDFLFVDGKIDRDIYGYIKINCSL